ncbi:hypothetical protein GCM10009092_23250 [Bowmanella denitrificans]|uniref:Lipoprotein n=1 Tax=Bowmanella denitrificans TaxID=366582 RepID=A0ABN0X9D2_9ALTE|nr:hypothetical protein [Bowmanella denitrificans]
MKIKQLFLALPFCFLGVFAQAETLASALQACTKEQNSLKRLVCYDKVAKDASQFEGGDRVLSTHQAISQVRGQSARQDGPLPTQQTVETTSQEQNFGLEHVTRPENEEDKIYVTLQSKDQDAYGKLILTLTNGQIWKQSDSGNFPIPNGQLYIERGMLGAFFLSSDEANRKIRVKRIK